MKINSAPPEAFASPQTVKPLQLGIIGCGGILRKIYSEILAGLTDVAHVACLCDLSEANLKLAGALFPSARCYNSIARLLHEEKLDAVMVLCSEQANATVCMQVLQAGIPVYLEKPPALTREEFDRLREAEECSGTPLFVAFNRRHAPLLQGLQWPNPPYRVEGRMLRLGRNVSDFPYTSLHLLDTMLYFSQAKPSEVDIHFKAEPPACWQIHCRLDEDCTATLDIVPDGEKHRESLMVRAQGQSLELQFPNPESPYAEGRIISTGALGRQIKTGERGISAHEQMGYAPALRRFLEHVRAGDKPPTIYQLSSCRSGIELMEDMMDAFKAQSSIR